jgi:hypothetical protein
VSQQINLYETRLRPRRELATGRNLGVCALVLLLAVVAASVGAQRDAVKKSEAAADLQKQLAVQQEALVALSKAVAERKVSPDLAAALEKARGDLVARSAVMEVLESDDGASPRFSAIMAGFARQARSDLWLTGFRATRGGADVEIHGRTLDPSTLPAYVQRLRSEPVFQGRRFSGLDMLDKAPEDAAQSGDGKTAPRPMTVSGAAKTPRHVEFVLHSYDESEKPNPSGNRRAEGRQ